MIFFKFTLVSHNVFIEFWQKKELGTMFLQDKHWLLTKIILRIYLRFLTVLKTRNKSV